MDDVREAPSEVLQRSPGQMDGMLENMRDRGYGFSRDTALQQSVDRKQEYLEELQRMDPSINGNVDKLYSEMHMYDRELGRRQNWRERAGALEAREESEERPGFFGRIWNGIKEHPWLTTAAVATLIGVGFYSGGLSSMMRWISTGYDWTVTQLTEYLPGIFPTSNRLPGIVNPQDGVLPNAP